MRVVTGRLPHRVHLLWPLLLALAQPLAAAKIYQYTNSAGETVFTDEPVEGATVHEVEDAPVIPMEPVEGPDSEPAESPKGAAESRSDEDDDAGMSVDNGEAASTPDRQGQAEAQEPAYRHLSIVEPADGEVASRLQGSITVELAMQPNLQGGDRIRILVDGEPRVRDSSGRRHLINGLTPGKHVLVAQIHRNGEVVKESAPVRFQLMTPSQ